MILVTGGLSMIGAHTARAVLEELLERLWQYQRTAPGA
jgi:nucleoside-diphosphate-sugar epimerase